MTGRPRIIGFVDPRSGEWRELKDPDGDPTARQLLALYRAYALEMCSPGDGEKFTKAEAGFVIDRAIADGLLKRRVPVDPAERFDRVCAAIVAFVAAHPGCTQSAVLRAVHGGRAYIVARLRDLVEMGALVDRAPWQGQGRRRVHWSPNHDAGEESTA